MPTKYVHLNGNAVYLHYAGPTTLPDVVPDFSKGHKIVFIHAAGSNGHTWQNQLSHLGQSHSPLAIDLPGHGRSSGVEGLSSVHDYADFVAAFMDAMKIKSAVIAGHSMGGAIAMDFASRHAGRVEGLILCATAAKFNVSKEMVESHRAVMMGRAPQSFTTDAYSPKTVKENFDSVRWGWMEQIKTDPRVRYTDLVACEKADLRGELEKIKAPTLILVGADDNVTTLADAEGMHSKIKGSNVQVIPDAGHILIWERANEVNAAIEMFLSGLK